MNIPQQHVSGLITIAGLSDNYATQVLSALADPELHDIEQTAAALAKPPSALVFEDMKRALEAVFSLANARADLGSSIPDFVDDLICSMKTDSRDELHLAPERLEQFRRNLSRLLADENLVIASKVIYLRQDYEHMYCRARILTDVRPVYGEDRTAPPAAAVVVHILQLVYHEGGSTKEIHVALREDSIAALKIQLARAEEKEKSLKALLETAKVRTVVD